MKFFNYVSAVALTIVFSFAMAVPVLAFDGNPPVPTFDWAAISQALQSLVLALLPVLGAFVARWLNSKYQLERSKLSEQQQWMVDSFIRIMVIAAEQLKATEYVDNKLDYVEIMVEDFLSKHNIDMDVAEIRARIEAAVKEQFPKPIP